METWEKKKEKKEDKVTERKGCLWGVPASTDLCVYSCRVDTWNRIDPAAVYAAVILLLFPLGQEPRCCPVCVWSENGDSGLCQSS